MDATDSSARVTFESRGGEVHGTHVEGKAPDGHAWLAELDEHAPGEAARRVDSKGRTWARSEEPRATWYLVDMLPIWRGGPTPPEGGR